MINIVYLNQSLAVPFVRNLEIVKVINDIFGGAKHEKNLSAQEKTEKKRTWFLQKNENQKR